MTNELENMFNCCRMWQNSNGQKGNPLFLNKQTFLNQKINKFY